MISRRWAFACAIALLGCGSGEHAPPPSTVAVAPPSTSLPAPTSAVPPPSSTTPPASVAADTSPYELHEWGVIDLPPSTREAPIEIAAGAGRRVRPVGSGLGFRKPVVYAHLLDGATEQAFALRVTIPRGSFVEHFPPATIEGTTLTWPSVTAHAEHCATPPTGFVPEAERPSDGAAVPEVRDGEADVIGRLDRELIRRVVRRHANEVRYCYERELAQRPDLEGRLIVQFVIDPTGSVIASNVESSTLGSPPVETCVAQAARRWAFPAPESGMVQVRLPYQLQSSDAPTSPSRCPTADHVCETHELPYYDADSAACVTVGTRRSGLLFYRATATDLTLPIAATRDGRAVTATANASMEGAPGELVRITLLPGHRVVAARAPFPALGASVTLPVGEEELTHEQGVAELRTSLAALGMDDDEASAFVAAWADDLFAPSPHHAPAGLIPGPHYHDVLVHFLPAAAVSSLAALSATPPPRALRRAFMVRYDFGELPADP